jgi:hypothetical protein
MKLQSGDMQACTMANGWQAIGARIDCKRLKARRYDWRMQKSLTID